MHRSETSLRDCSGFMQTIPLRATNRIKTVSAFFFLFAIDVRDGNRSLAMDLLLELNGRWKEGAGMWWNIYRTCEKYGEAAEVPVTVFISLSSWPIELR